MLPAAPSEGAPSAHAGLVRFESMEGEGTRAQNACSYNPPGGWLGHGVADAVGVDPKSGLDADLGSLEHAARNGAVRQETPHSPASRDRAPYCLGFSAS
jgi:uncharacterized membrane protein